jgi:hypothetical protein
MEEKARIREIKRQGEQQYYEYKEKFEEKYYMISGKYYNLKQDGEFVPMSDRAIQNETAKMLCDSVDCKGEEKKEKFLNKWLSDPERDEYDDIKFYPPGFQGKKSRNDYFDLWQGFQIERDFLYNVNATVQGLLEKKKIEAVKNDEVIDYDEYEKNIRKQIEDHLNSDDEDTTAKLNKIFNHINLISGGHKDFFLKYFAWIVQKPGQKTETSIIIRDIEKTFNECGGTGKNLLIDYISENIIGNKYYHVVSENSELFESFNTSYNGKLIIFVEEADGN